MADAAVEQDTGLVAAVRQGDDRAFEELYGRYHPRIAAYVRGMVKDHARAEDVTQEVFFSALRRMRQTERPIAFKPWIYEIARNACIDSYRRTSRAEELSYDVEGGLPAADSMRLVGATPSLDDAVECKQRLDDLCGAFGGLSETHHQILVLRELEGLSYREIGERLGMSRAAVESTLFRARRRLTEEYDELVSGRRCQRVQAIIAAAQEGMLGARDRRKLARHVSTCHACRRQALHTGVEVGERRPLAARIAGALPFPLPFFLLRGRGGDAAGAGSSSSGVLAQASVTLGGAAEPLALAWTKGVAAVAVLAVAGAGAGAASQNGVAIPGLDRLPGIGADVREASRVAPAVRTR
ncbi:MAG TPA: RNA polymerase sigma factor, partial [Solirubrobacteraceae bacterium]|nr:RNA polymerase sigma factor [Solirubrobacteraceae bacterium]